MSLFRAPLQSGPTCEGGGSEVTRKSQTFAWLSRVCFYRLSGLSGLSILFAYTHSVHPLPAPPQKDSLRTPCNAPAPCDPV